MPLSQTCSSVTLDEIVCHGRALCDMLIHLTVVFEGRADIERMNRAVRLSLEAEPILGCRFKAAGWRGRWERRTDLDQAALCEVEETGQPKESLSRFLTRPMDPFNDLHVQLRIFRGDSDTLCIKMNHIAVDAGGVKEYAYLLADIYRQLEHNPDYRPPKNPLALQPGKRSLRQIFRQFSFRDYVRILKRSVKDFITKSSPPRFINPVLPGEKRADAAFCIHRIDPPLFLALKQYGKKQGATVNDMAVTAVLRALFGAGVTDRRRFCLITTADLRRYKPVWKGDAPCNLSGLCYLDIGESIPPRFKETLQKVSGYMKCLKSEAVGLGDMCSAVFLTRLLPMSWREKLFTDGFQGMAEKKDRFPPGMTNMGRIHDDQLDFGKLPVNDAFLTAPLIHPPFYIIGISGFKNCLHISIGIGDQARNRFMAERLIEKIDDEIYRAVFG